MKEPQVVFLLLLAHLANCHCKVRVSSQGLVIPGSENCYLEDFFKKISTIDLFLPSVKFLFLVNYPHLLQVCKNHLWTIQ